MTRNSVAIVAAIFVLTCAAGTKPATVRAETPLQATDIVTHYRTAVVDGISLFYREAGPSDGPVVVLLHGFPTSSRMFRNLIPALADRYRVIAPDYPGFGQSAAPDHTQFEYSFAHYASLVDALLQHLGATRYAMYVMDYGAPVGYRLALLSTKFSSRMARLPDIWHDRSIIRYDSTTPVLIGPNPGVIRMCVPLEGLRSRHETPGATVTCRQRQ